MGKATGNAAIISFLFFRDLKALVSLHRCQVIDQTDGAQLNGA